MDPSLSAQWPAHAVADPAGSRTGGARASDPPASPPEARERPAAFALDPCGNMTAGTETLTPSLSRAKEDFLTLVSHELRSPLNAIRGWAHVLRQAPAGSDVFDRALSAIERNSAHQLKLVEDLLDSARIVAGTLAVVPDWTALNAVVERAWESACLTAKGRQLCCDLQLDPTIGQVRVDARRLGQVIDILLSNALKFTPPGGRVSLTTRRDGHRFEIVVADSGCGIASAFLPFVFDPFRQADSSATRGQGGMGIGLFLARSIVAHHGGRIRAESAGPGAGTTVIVNLPRACGVDAPPYPEGA